MLGGLAGRLTRTTAFLLRRNQRGFSLRRLKRKPNGLSRKRQRIVLINGIAWQPDRLYAGCGMTIPADDLVQVM